MDLLSLLYVEAGLSALKNPPAAPPGWHYALDRTFTRNPYATIGFGLEYEVSDRVRFSLGYRHTSSLATREDCGDDALHLTVTVKPWGRL